MPWRANTTLTVLLLCLLLNAAGRGVSHGSQQQGTGHEIAPAAAPRTKPPAKPKLVTAEKPPVTLQVTPSTTAVTPGGKLTLSVVLIIKQDWHINSHTPYQDYLIPATITVTSATPVTVGAIRYPAGSELVLGGETLSVYEGELKFMVPISIAKTAKAGKTELQVELRFQACDGKSCLAPEKVTVRVPVIITSKKRSR